MLLGLITCLAVVNYGVYHPFLVRTELNRLYAAFVYVRRKALLEGRTQRIIFYEGERSFTVDTTQYLAPQVLFVVPQKVKGPPGNPTKVITRAITFKNSILEAYQDGTLSAGTLYLADEARSCLYALTTDASAITGLRRYRYIFSSQVWKPLE